RTIIPHHDPDIFLPILYLGNQRFQYRFRIEVVIEDMDMVLRLHGISEIRIAHQITTNYPVALSTILLNHWGKMVHRISAFIFSSLVVWKNLKKITVEDYSIFVQQCDIYLVRLIGKLVLPAYKR